jgi:hypothetical protein
MSLLFLPYPYLHAYISNLTMDYIQDKQKKWGWPWWVYIQSQGHFFIHQIYKKLI